MAWLCSTTWGSCPVMLCWSKVSMIASTVYPKKYAHGFCFAVLWCVYTLTNFPISIRLTSLALWQSNDCPSASKATLMNMDKYFMWIHYKRLHNHNKAKHNKTVCIFLGIYCMLAPVPPSIFRSNSKFDENSKHCSVKCTRPITTIFCTRHNSVTVVTCAKYRYDRSSIFETRSFWILIDFRIWSKYA